MLPIVNSASRELIANRRLSCGHPTAVVGVEALSGEWQRAPQFEDKPSTRTYEGELFVDDGAVEAYLQAAGRTVETKVGQLVSVFA